MKLEDVGTGETYFESDFFRLDFLCELWAEECRWERWLGKCVVRWKPKKGLIRVYN